MQVPALHVAPVFSSKWPNHSHSHTVVIKALLFRIFIQNKAIWIIEILEGRAIANLVFRVILIIPDKDTIILIELCYVDKACKYGVEHILCQRHCMDELRLLESKAKNELVILVF